METRLGRAEDMPASIGLPKSAVNPIKPELFVGTRQSQLAKAVGCTQFGVNHVTLEPGSISSLRHWREGEDEFVYVLSGQLVLIDENGEHALTEGAFAGFPAGCPNAHHLANRSDAPATFIAIGTRKPGQETIHYPDDDLGPSKVFRDAAGNRV